MPKKKTQKSSPIHIYDRLPQGFSYAGAYYRFQLIDGLRDPDNPKVKTKYDGLTCFEKNLIYLESKLNPYNARETVLHEVMHVIFEQAGIHERLYPGSKLKVNNEFLVTVITKQLLLFWAYNPELYNAIFQ